MPPSDSGDPRVIPLHRCFEHARSPTTVCTRGGVIVYQNLAARELASNIWGPSASPATFIEMFVEEDRSALIVALDALNPTHANIHIKGRLANDDRTRMAIDAYLYGDGEHVVLTMQPSEKSSREQRFRTMAQASHDAIWEWNTISDELSWHAGLRDFFGYDEHEFTSTTNAWTDR